ncbi:MAG: PDZ domain-containing protein [Pseudomonadota bacterium]
MKRHVILSICLFAGGAAAGAVARDALTDPAPEDIPSTPVPSAGRLLEDMRQLPTGDDGPSLAVVNMLESLSQALTQEAEYRMVLEDQIDSLSGRLDELQARLEAGGGASEDSARRTLKARQQRGGGLTLDRLLDSGMDETTARRFKSRVDDIALQRLYLRDQAMREGWVSDPRYRDESRRLAEAQNGLRDEFGTEAYDAYLYASGRPNRIEVQNVLENSPAFEAGLRTGDQIVGYDGERTFQPNELRRATQQGQAGQMISVQIIRNGQTLDVYVPRGPLGVQMSGRSVRPDG